MATLQVLRDGGLHPAAFSDLRKGDRFCWDIPNNLSGDDLFTATSDPYVADDGKLSVLIAQPNQPRFDVPWMVSLRDAGYKFWILPTETSTSFVEILQ